MLKHLIKEKYIECMFYIELFTLILSVISLSIEIAVLKYLPLFTVNTLMLIQVFIYLVFII